MKNYLEDKPARNKGNRLVKDTQTGNLIYLSEFYEEYEDSDESVVVSDEVLAFLIESKRAEKRAEMRDYRHCVPFAFDELSSAAIEGIHVQAVDDAYFQALDSEKLYTAFRSLNQVQQRRISLFYFEKYSLKQIGEMEGVSAKAIRLSIDGALATLRKLLSDYYD